MLLNDIRSKTCSKPGLALLAMFVCAEMLLANFAVASDETASDGLRLEQTFNQLLGEQEAERYEHIFAPDAPISWQVYLPKNNSTETPGVLVYVSPRSSGQIDPRWRSVMDELNLIYISANNSGNRIATYRRMVLATMSVRALGQQHSFSSERIYVTGFSGGGRVASLLASQYPGAFSGAIYICGVDFWKESQATKIERLVQNRFVFLTGSKDFNRDETRSVYRKYVKAGAQHSKLMVVPGLRHEHPDAKDLTEALKFLDGME